MFMPPPEFIHPLELDISDVDPIKQFVQEYHFLSNFYPAPITYNNFTWKSVEHAYQAHKQVPIPAYELNLLTPGKAKRAGNHLFVDPKWETRKFHVMHELVWLKFTSHDEIAVKLLQTGRRKLIEGNWHKDEYWGFYFETQRGLNKLGQILMSHRFHLANLYGITLV